MKQDEVSCKQVKLHLFFLGFVQIIESFSLFKFPTDFEFKIDQNVSYFSKLLIGDFLIKDLSKGTCSTSLLTVLLGNYY